MPTSAPVHRPVAWKPSAPKRSADHRRRYDRAWEKVRLVILQRDPLCLFCYAAGVLTPSHQVDHIKTIDEAPELRLDPRNLRGLCDSCHSKRTADYMRGNVY